MVRVGAFCSLLVPIHVLLIKGVINPCRGKVLLVVDLRLKFRLDAAGVHATHLHHRDSSTGRVRVGSDGDRG